MAQNKLMTTDNLIKRGWTIPSICHLCRNQKETAQHLFSQCEYTIQAKQMIMQYYGHTITFTATFRQGEMQEMMQEQGGIKPK
jgi:zinc-binding in reverse transcriptase